MDENPGVDMSALLAEAGWLRRFARALVSDAEDADDLTQDTLARATGRLRLWSPGDTLANRIANRSTLVGIPHAELGEATP